MKVTGKSSVLVILKYLIVVLIVGVTNSGDFHFFKSTFFHHLTSSIELDCLASFKLTHIDD